MRLFFINVISNNIGNLEVLPAILAIIMDLPENNDVTGKSWDHPWTTNEMRQHQNDWSLAADAGLLKHLQHFSNNLTEQFTKTQEKLNSLSNDLEEASVIIDNITNTSLALANTQFIESRVHEDEVEIENSQSIPESNSNKEDLYKDDLIACVNESIKQGLNIMDEKFERLEVLASDSEDEGDIPVPSVVLKPKDPYQNRPLPYIIGTEKWKTSNKVGLESSSSDSESPEAEKDSESESEEEIRQTIPIPNNVRHESMLRRSLSSSSSSGLSGRNEQTNASKDYSSLRTDKLEARSQDTLNSGSEIATPSVAESRTENSSRAGPSFAEELAKRLGKVLPSDRSVRDSQDADQSSINRFKDDLFAPEDNDVFANKSQNLFSDNGNLFDEDISNSLWKNKPYRPPISNIIPPSLDVPPPMNTEARKPKSAFDDLCGDPESEDSDNIFAPKSSYTNEPPKLKSTSKDKHENSDEKGKKLLNVASDENSFQIATSTPIVNDNGGLFGDDDDDVLFGNPTQSQSRLPEKTPESVPKNRQALPGLSITQADILASNLGSRLFQHLRQQGSSDSSDTESPVQNPDVRSNDRVVQESDSSGISILPNNNTVNNTLGADFQPEWESTRLKSEEIYRERFASDSLFEGRGANAESTNSTDSNQRQHNVARFIAETLDTGREEDFDVDDVFGPPPLPKHNDSKSKSNDDLFSNSSSESRSHKSFDLLATGESQYDVKITSDRGGGLFDEDIDIFGSGDAPQIDIFGEAFKPTSFVSRESSEQPVAKIQSEPKGNSSSSNKLDSSTEKVPGNVKASSTARALEESVVKSSSIFDDSEDDNDDDLFGHSFLKSNRTPRKIMLESEDDEIFTNKPTTTTTTAVNETKKEPASSLARENVANTTSTERDLPKHDSDKPATEKPLPSFSSSGLFDNLEEKDADDSLFVRDVSNDEATSEKTEDKLFDDVATSEKSKKEESGFKSNRAKFEDIFKGPSVDESGMKKPATKEADSDNSPRNTTPETSHLKKEDSSKNLFEDEKDASTTDGAKISKASNLPDVIGDNTKRHPPKTLSIRLPVASEDSSQPPPRRVVSDKIKHLKGKMGDFKVLSPTDTPPVWRKSKEKTESESEKTESKDSEDGGLMSVPSATSPTNTSNKGIDDSVETANEIAPSSPPDDSGNSESAVSFDVPAQVEVLAVTASKSRARIQAKRRPQSRHARQSALRKSGIDFDTVDNTGSEAVESDPSDNTFSGISEKIPTLITDSIGPDLTRSDRLAEKESEAGKLSSEKAIVETSSSLAPEDRSEMSFSKGSSLSLNKNTLLSPSTDEEDLFDVPPDLPEDPPKEDTLFGRAPILSPIDRSLGRKITRVKEKSREKYSNIESEEAARIQEKMKSSEDKSKTETISESESATEKPTDPLRDNNHDPLKDPSQLFAFVTKTPSPEKGQNLLFKEDASLFTQLAKKAAEEARLKKPVLDLFADDNSGDLFSETLAKSTKKPMRAIKSDSLFDDLENPEEDFTVDLFGSRSKNSQEKTEKMEDSVTSKSSETSGRASPNRGSIFAAADDDDLFVNLPVKKVSSEPEKQPESKEKITKDPSSKSRDIFGDQSSGEEDLFTKSKIIGSGKSVGASGSIFSAAPNDEDADDIFGTRTSSKSTKIEPNENRSSVKKAVTRDLKKTAETIVQDPLSMLQDD
ncbi:WASH complex subunit 2 [Venturia canescens]|uniref:WASH complex subunit 2 n=1 Tax=Venturia canescens TaxID=32260 RepID=UPI001C9D44AC|nr:WASH complex subunit 2 [Venturia canescens]